MNDSNYFKRILSFRNVFLQKKLFTVLKNEVSIVGVPFSGGQRKKGVEKSPDLLRREKLFSCFDSSDYRIYDCGNITIPPRNNTEDKYRNVLQPKLVGKVTNILSDVVFSQVNKERKVLVLGGDHSISIGSIHGLLRHFSDLFVIWVDAHGDIHNIETSPSGNLHGMSLRFLLGDILSCPGFEWLQQSPAKLKLKNLIYVGLRDIEKEEREFIQSMEITVFGMNEIRKWGIEPILESIKKKIQNRFVHLSFDIDSLDPNEAPATGTSVKGTFFLFFLCDDFSDGLMLNEGIQLCTGISELNLVSMDLVEVNSSLGHNDDQINRTIQSALRLIRAAFTKKSI